MPAVVRRNAQDARSSNSSPVHTPLFLVPRQENNNNKNLQHILNADTSEALRIAVETTMSKEVYGYAGGNIQITAALENLKHIDPNKFIGVADLLGRALLPNYKEIAKQVWLEPGVKLSLADKTVKNALYSASQQMSLKKKIAPQPQA